jgi:hypothetical protein
VQAKEIISLKPPLGLTIIIKYVLKIKANIENYKTGAEIQLIIELFLAGSLLI